MIGEDAGGLGLLSGFPLELGDAGLFPLGVALAANQLQRAAVPAERSAALRRHGNNGGSGVGGRGKG